MMTGSITGRRRSVFVLIALGALIPACLDVPFSGSNGRSGKRVLPGRPSIILLLTDDQDASYSPAYMPILQKELAAQGTTFGNAFVTEAVCCPSRASILRGQYPHNTGVLDNALPTGGFGVFKALGEEASTVATWLHDAGYRTALIGKYLNQYGSLDSTHIPPGWDEWDAAFGPSFAEEVAYYDYIINENGILRHFDSDYGDGGDYETDVMTRLSMVYLRKVTADTAPFFLYLAPAAPHEPPIVSSRYLNSMNWVPPYQPPSFNEGDVSDKAADVRNRPLLDSAELAYIRFLWPRRLEQLKSVDDMIDSITNVLAQAGRLDNTYIFYFSDNGFHMGEHRFPPGKGRVYEEDIRVPLVVRGPGVRRGVIQPLMALNIDLAPTFAEIAGVTPPAFIDGRSLMPLLEGSGDGATWRHAFEAWSPLPVTAIRTDKYLFARYANGEYELYDLEHDPFEMQSIYATADPALIQRLAAWLTQLEDCAGSSCRDADRP